MTDSSFGSSAQRAARKEALCSGPQRGLAHKAPLQRGNKLFLQAPFRLTQTAVQNPPAPTPNPLEGRTSFALGTGNDRLNTEKARDGPYLLKT